MRIFPVKSCMRIPVSPVPCCRFAGIGGSLIALNHDRCQRSRLSVCERFRRCTVRFACRARMESPAEGGWLPRHCVGSEHSQSHPDVNLLIGILAPKSAPCTPELSPPVRWNVSVSRKVREKFTHHPSRVRPKTVKNLGFPHVFAIEPAGAGTA